LPSGQIAEYLQDLEKSAISGAPILRMEKDDDIRKEVIGTDHSGGSESSDDDTSSIANALEETLPCSESDDTFDPSQFDWSKRRRRGKQRKAQKPTNDRGGENEQIMDLLSELRGSWRIRVVIAVVEAVSQELTTRFS
jgi:hypothetical protein